MRRGVKKRRGQTATRGPYELNEGRSSIRTRRLGPKGKSERAVTGVSKKESRRDRRVHVAAGIQWAVRLATRPFLVSLNPHFSISPTVAVIPAVLLCNSDASSGLIFRSHVDFLNRKDLTLCWYSSPWSHGPPSYMIDRA